VYSFEIEESESKEQNSDIIRCTHLFAMKGSFSVECALVMASVINGCYGSWVRNEIII
jgi:hypothetical protein